MAENSNSETLKSRDEQPPIGKTTDSTISRRRALQLGGLVGAGSLLGVAGAGIDGVAAAESNAPDEVVHIDYDDYDSWDDVYRMSNGDSDNVEFVSNPTYSGESAVQIRVNENDHWGASTHYDFEDGLVELNTRVRFALDTDWSMEGRDLANCRIWNCAMARGEASAGGGVPDGTNGWSNRMYVTTRGTDPDGPYHLLSNTYHMDDPQDHDYIMDGEEYALEEPEIVPGTWYDFEYYIRVNTVANGDGNNDGIIRYWLDEDLIYERENFRFTDDLEDNAIETNGPVGHYGGRYTAPQTLYTYYDTHSMAFNGALESGSCDAEDGSDDAEDGSNDSDNGSSGTVDRDELEDEIDEELDGELDEVEDELEDSGVVLPEGIGELFSS